MRAIGQDENIRKRIELTQKFVPFTPSAASFGVGWKALQAVRYRKSPAGGEFSLPPVSRHRLVLTIPPAERLEAWYDGVWVDKPAAPGSINVIPAGSSVLWRRQGSMDALLVNLKPSVVTQVAAESFATVLAVHLIRHLTGSQRELVAADGVIPGHKLRRVIEYIMENLGNNPTLEQMAAVVHLSPYHFARQFKAATGLAPHQYVISRRVEREEAVKLPQDH
jgi:AraC family transcriptional regulator